jgi:glutathione S-transferase
MSTTTLLLHQYEVSPFAAKVRRALRYKGIPFTVRNYAVAEAGRIRRTISPTGKTPVLDHNGRLIVDSTAILRYLDAHFDGPALLPVEPRLRARAHIIEDWADESLFFYDLTVRSWPNNIDWLTRDVLSHDRGFGRWLLARLMPRIIAKMSGPQGIGRKDPKTVCAELADNLDALANTIDDAGWLVGDELSVADIAVASMCTVLDRAEEARAMMQDRPVILAWRGRVDAATFAPGTAPEAMATS